MENVDKKLSELAEHFYNSYGFDSGRNNDLDPARGAVPLLTVLFMIVDELKAIRSAVGHNVITLPIKQTKEEKKKAKPVEMPDAEVAFETQRRVIIEEIKKDQDIVVKSLLHGKLIDIFKDAKESKIGKLVVKTMGISAVMQKLNEGRKVPLKQEFFFDNGYLLKVRKNECRLA